MKMKNAALFLVFVGLLFVACSSENEKDLMTEAKNHIEQQKYQEALVIFEKIVNEFPETDEAGLAYLEMAKLYHGKAIKNISEKQAYLKAVEYYQTVNEKYPQLPEAPGALFMSGFLQANEINDLEAARITYQKFLDKYPDDELAPSAQSELENLGLTPEEILEKAVIKPE